MWREWKIKFLNVVDTHAPVRTKRVRSKRSPWITSELKKGMHDRGIMKLKAIRSKNPHDWAEFKRLRNKVNGDIKIAKESYYKKSFNVHKNDPRRTWQTINELTSRKNNTSFVSMGNRMGRVKLRINITRVFRNCRNCPSRAATRAISAISENTSDINP